MAKEEQINIRLTKEEKKQLQKDAQDHERPVSNFVLWLWKQWRDAKKGKGNERRST